MPRFLLPPRLLVDQNAKFFKIPKYVPAKLHPVSESPPRFACLSEAGAYLTGRHNKMGQHVKIESEIPLLEEILSKWRKDLQNEYLGYRNHVYRVIHFCLAIRKCTAQEQDKIIIAGAFHDIGIWTNNTMDYIPPSIHLAGEYLRSKNIENWSNEIKLMISEHHKIRLYKDESYQLVELFRKGDLIDVSLGLFTFGIPKEFIKNVKAKFPNENFHKNIGKRMASWMIKHPLIPAPMVKW